MGHISYSEPSSSEPSYGFTPYSPYRDFGDTQEATSAPPRKPGAGIPYKCFCGLTPITQTSTTEKNPGRVFYGCKNAKNGRYHLFKWLDEALMDEIEEIRSATTKQGECIRQMEDWYNYQEYPTIKALEKDISELKALVIENRPPPTVSEVKIENQTPPNPAMVLVKKLKELKYILGACLIVIIAVVVFISV